MNYQDQELIIYEEGVKDGKKEIIDREIKMLCLNCGTSLHREIMDKKIHLHLCKNCRLIDLKQSFNVSGGL